MLATLIPCPEELNNEELTTWGRGEEEQAREALRAEMVQKYGYQSWYDWCTAKWGTKWDLSDPSFSSIDDNTVQITCDTAWGPPLAAYQTLREEGYTVHAYYHEPGSQFAGIWDNGIDEYYEGWGDSRGAKKALPQELDDTFSISENQAQWERDDSEDLHRWIVDGLEAREALEDQE